MTATSHTAGVIVVAAGNGERLGAPVPKAFVPIAGLSLLARAVDAVLRMESRPCLIAVVPEGWESRARVEIDAVAGMRAATVEVVRGGATRQQSVAAGLVALPSSVEKVLVHDAARALMPVEVLDAVAAAVDTASATAVVPGEPLVDTIKRIDSRGVVLDGPDRAELRAVQTPQGFPRRLFEAAHGDARTEFSDDTALYAAAGHPVRVLPGHALGFKITTPWDLQRAELLAEAGGSGDGHRPAHRTGIGLDVHAYDDGSPLWLGGIYWPGEPGLAGHSDGDVLSHAICDALLSAAGLGDMGTRFGLDAERYRDAHGDVFLAEALELVTGAGHRVVNVAVQLIGIRPRLAERRAEIEARLSALVDAPVSVAGTTSDGLGFTGRGEGIAAIATALLEQLPPR